MREPVTTTSSTSAALGADDAAVCAYEAVANNDKAAVKERMDTPSLSILFIIPSL
jgi:hypothetical protein